jgi:hypothetical protein
VRSHAKASTAGSTKRQGKSLGGIFRGADAGRGALLEAKGSSASKSGFATLALTLSVALLSLAIVASSALAAAPTIGSTGVSAVTTKSAVLEAEINPEGEATTYHFEYGPADCASNPCTSVPSPDANVGSGSSTVPIEKEVEGLSAGTTYHYRVVASNGAGTTKGSDATFTTYVPLVPDTDCPNQAFRYGPSALLPDCRAYEMVSPVDKQGGSIEDSVGFSFHRVGFWQSAIDGGKITYSSPTAFGDQGDALNISQYLATRGPEGWSTHGINSPKTGPIIFEPFIGSGSLFMNFYAFSPDLSSAWLRDFNEIPLTADANPKLPNLYRRDNLDGSYEALTNVPPLPGGKDPGVDTSSSYYSEFAVEGVSGDGSEAVFVAPEPLTPDADPASVELQLYMYSEGETHLVSVLPDGTASPSNNQAGAGFSGFEPLFQNSGTGSSREHAVSEDGTRVFWQSSGSGPPRLYVRENPAEEQSAIVGGECTEPAKACTIQIGGVGAPAFRTASPDGSAVLFTEGIGFGGEHGLYRFDVDTETTTLIAKGQGDYSGLVGAGEDLSRLYFVSSEALAPGATAGQPNLYLHEGGADTFIATLAETDVHDPGVDVAAFRLTSSPYTHAARVSADGRHLAFTSTADLTAYDNTDALNGKADAEVYHYDAETQQLSCASCNPSGARPVGARLAVGALTTPSETWGAAWLPSPQRELHATRPLAEDGTIFFNAHDALLPRDTNGAMDVYEWKPQGVRGCERAAGCLDLISTGQSAEESRFIDASADGDEVFFTTASGIVLQDPGSVDLYVAKVGGGYPQPPSPPECVGDACQSIPAAPDDPTPASAGFRGAGDPAPQRARRRCKARNRHAGRGGSKAKRKKAAKRCRRPDRRAAR